MLRAALLIALALVTYVVAYTRVPGQLGYRTYPVLGYAGEPVISPGSLVVTTRQSALAVTPGDVLAYRRPEEPGLMLFHRVIEVRPPEWSPRTGRLVSLVGSPAGGAEPAVYEVEMHGVVNRVLFAVPLLGAVAASALGSLVPAATIAVAIGMAFPVLLSSWHRAHAPTAAAEARSTGLSGKVP
jgi:hypothetical protein